MPDSHVSEPPSLEQPRSLHSIPMELAPHGYYLPPCSSHGAPCCGPGPGHAFWMNPRPHIPDVRYHVPYSSSCTSNSKPSDPELVPSRHEALHPQPKSVPSTAPLSLEQRKVFVTYEADNENHVKEVINFVALLRHNGFYTHIDMFEQQFRSISKIDFMERYITEKDYLIIIIISPKYFEIVTNASLCIENDETLNTVYIHKQLQNEFIQNGCRNFRFIPVLFPGAKRGLSFITGSSVTLIEHLATAQSKKP
ncbi:adapter protein CIKS-like isoform X2 [Clarias magur]|uniref:Adapter protein CIKS-like isoform X2 n=1 Tax=Clarias magur TaxID=1594786 RepID=A0A8J4U9D6_CLAMG|nr:adapter protein CIKS-like isoform X2 [Clarias magur]